MDAQKPSDDVGPDAVEEMLKELGIQLEGVCTLKEKAHAVADCLSVSIFDPAGEPSGTI